MKLVYSKEGMAVPDCDAEEVVKLYVSASRDLKVSTENVITAARALVHEGVISRDNIEIYFEDQLLELDNRGRLQHWPKGFCDYNEDWLHRLLGWGR